MYGVEIWRCKEYEQVVRLLEEYIRCTLELDRCMPGYIALKEMDGEKTKNRAGYGACKLEKKSGEAMAER